MEIMSAERSRCRCSLVNNMNCTAQIGAAVFLVLIEDTVTPDKKTIGGDDRFGKWAPPTCKESASWAVVEVNLRLDV